MWMKKSTSSSAVSESHSLLHPGGENNDGEKVCRIALSCFESRIPPQFPSLLLLGAGPALLLCALRRGFGCSMQVQLLR